MGYRRNAWRTRAGWLALPLLVSGCGAEVAGSFQASGFWHNTYAYGVRRQPDRSLVSPDYTVDNYYVHGDDDTRMKVGDDYETRISIDIDGDGRTDTVGSTWTYDLQLRNRRTASKLWVRTMPLSWRFDRTELRVLAHDYVDAASGAGFTVRQIDERTVEAVLHSVEDA